jgi:hypothetical protein
MLAITGIEADYDGEKITVAEAVEKLEKAGIVAMVYTSPSHTEAAPRWRVICPTSRELTPDQREKLMGRLNGLFGGVFSGESWTLSQSYYYGSVNHNPAHRVELIAGTPIDLHDDLDEIWMGKPNTSTTTKVNGERVAGPLDEAALLAKITIGASYHEPTVRLLGRWALQGVPMLEARQRLLEAFDAVPADDRNDRWQSRRGDVNRCLENVYVKEAKQRDEGRRPTEPPPHPGYDVSEVAAVAALVAEFNAQFLVVSEAGKAMIYAPAEDPILHRRYFDRLGFDDLRRLYLNRRIELGRDDKNNPILRPVADVWLRHAERRQFIRGITFDPSGAPTSGGTLNLWQGFAVEPKPGRWDLLKRHIFEIICGSCQDRFDYLMNWLARMVQHPAEQGEVAVVMRGGEGTGKGTLARAMTRMLGQHGLAISNSKHLTGNFNAHLRDCVFLFADEAFYAGDPSHVGVLKSIITEPYLTIEAKYQNAVQMPNFLHLMMASNEEWVVPAALDARRFFVLEVSGAHANDHDWFGAIWQEMEAGGYEAMLHDLLHHDLTGFNVRRVPDTDGLQEQRKLSLGTSEAWWLDVLHRGYVFKSKLGLESFFGEWHAAMTTEMLFGSYSEFAKGRNERHPMNREAFGKFMVKMGAKPVKPRNAVTGERIADVQTTFGTTRKAELVKQERATGYSIGVLMQARRVFGTATGLSPAWPSEAPDEEAEG